jgi:hypothetical protein
MDMRVGFVTCYLALIILIDFKFFRRTFVENYASLFKKVREDFASMLEIILPP